MSKEFTTIQIDEYNGVQLQVYDGIWGILSMKRGGGENITYFKKWVYESILKKGIPIPGKRKFPVAVRLGDKETAIETLESILKQVKGEI